jgi:hypothetical protein
MEQVFISWSGDRSQDVAGLLSDWLVCVIQAVRPWVSNRDLDRGTLWFGEISDQLRDTSVGIICLTQENLNRPWILFEAGALAKGLATSRVCTLLVDLEPQHIKDPLAQFNHTMPNKNGMQQLIKTINSSISDRALDHRILEQVFETYWPQFEKKFGEIIAKTKSKTPEKPPKQEDLLEQILEQINSLNTRVRRSEMERGLFSRKVRLSPEEVRVEIEKLLERGASEEEILLR